MERAAGPPVSLSLSRALAHPRRRHRKERSGGEAARGGAPFGEGEGGERRETNAESACRRRFFGPSSRSKPKADPPFPFPCPVVLAVLGGFHTCMPRRNQRQMKKKEGGEAKGFVSKREEEKK